MPEDEWFLRGHFPGRPIMPGVIMVEALAQAAGVAALSLPEHRGKLALFAGIDDVRFKRIVTPGETDARLRDRGGPRPDRQGQGGRARRRRARRARQPDLRGDGERSDRVIGSANGLYVSITGLGVHVPERVVTNDELAKIVDTSDEWIVTRTGIRERRLAAPDEALSDIALPAARAALEQAGADRRATSTS